MLLTVSAPAGIKEEAESYLRRELRALRDVDLVETNASYILRVVVLETSSQSGIKTGYAASTSEASKPSIDTLRDFLKHDHKLTDEGGVWLRTAIQDLEIYRTQNLFVGADLKRICERVVAGFDSDLLEEGRKFTKQFREILKRTGQNAPKQPTNEIPFYLRFQPAEPKKP